MSDANRRLHGRVLLILLILVVAIALPMGSASAQRPLASQGKPATGRIQAGLVGRAKAHGAVRVIVNLRASSATTGLRTASARADFKRTVKTRTTRVARIARDTGGKVARRYKVVPAIAMYATPRTIARLKASPDVASVGIDRLNLPTLDWNVPLVEGGEMQTAGFGGAGQIVAVLDTGVQVDHPMLSGKVVGEACFASGGSVDEEDGGPGPVGDCPNGAQSQIGAGAAAPCTWVPDCLHGTHVSGIAVGRYLAATSQHRSVAGVARDAGLLPIQVFSDFTDPVSGERFIGAWNSDMAAAMEYVFQQESSHAFGARHVAAVNLSIGGDATSVPCDDVPSEAAIKTAATALRTLGIPTVFAAGNDGDDYQTSYPGCLSTVITVSATTRADTLAEYSNIASWVDIEAPGSSIYSSIPGGYETLSGTSMAAPHVAGAWAEIRSRFPDASVDVVRGALRATGKAVTLREPVYHVSYVKRRIRIMDAGDWLGFTATSLTRTPSSVKSGATVTFKVTVTRLHAVGRDPIGKVVLKVAGVKVASVSMDPDTGTSDTAVVTIKSKVTGSHGARVSIQAFYKGDGRFVASQSPVVKVAIK